MTLSERINAADPQEIFYVGAASGFVFIGNKERFVKDIAEVSKTSLEFFVKNLKKDISILKRYSKEFRLHLFEDEEVDLSVKEEDLEKVCRECADIRKSLQSYIAGSSVRWAFIALSGALDNIEKLSKTCKKYPIDKKIVATYIPIDCREVKEEYPRITGGTALIIDGYENGKYWLQEEYEAGIVEKDEDEESESE